MMKKRIIALLLVSGLLLMNSVGAFAATKVYSTATPDQWTSQKYTGFSYEHSPLLNSKAMEDIIVNENAIYGFSPNPDSRRLGAVLLFGRE